MIEMRITPSVLNHEESHIVALMLRGWGVATFDLDFDGLKELSLNLEQIWKDLRVIALEAEKNKTHGCEHSWLVELIKLDSPVVYCRKCKRQKPLLPVRIFQKLIEDNQ